MTSHPPRAVWAVDVTTTVISLARIVESDEPAIPQIGKVTPVSVATHSPYSTWHHAEAAAQQVIEKLTANGAPTSVIMAKNFWGTPNSDPSADRRARIYHAIEGKLFERGIPVSEFPYLTASKWLLGYTPRGKSKGGAMAQLEAAAGELWNIHPVKEPTAAGGEKRVPFRVPVTVLAAVAAMGVGVEVAEVPVTDVRLTIMGGQAHAYGDGNMAVQWAKGMQPPRTVDKWEKLHDNPSLIKVRAAVA